MASSLLMRLTGVSASIGADTLYSDVSLNIHKGDRLALVGRNGAGKSTLAAQIAGRRELGSGERWVSGGVSISYLEQNPDISGYPTLGDLVSAKLGKKPIQRAQSVARGLNFSPGTKSSEASGGEIRRAALASLLVDLPDLLILDEPTNHLDIQAIVWMEGFLQECKSAILLISHDRAMLRALSDRTIWIDRGALRQSNRGFSSFEDWRDEIFEQEVQRRHKLDRKIKAETKWSIEGISARRKRNQGRLHKLQELRAEQRAMPERKQFGSIEFAEDITQSRIIAEAKSVSKSYGDHTIVNRFSLLLRRGERIAFVGPNGCGKSTLLSLLARQLQPDSGKVTHRINTKPATFFQTRCRASDTMTVRDYLVGRGVNSRDRPDRIFVGNRSRHVTSYLRDFLFSESQINSPLDSLSGGERVRLELSRIMARESNLLILDEPTNDLDLETLDLLHELISEYSGAVLLASHDRDFLNRVATATVVFEGVGKWVTYAGGWSDSQAGKAILKEAAPTNKKAKKVRKTAIQRKSAKKGLSFTESFRLREIEKTLPTQELVIAELAAKVADLTEKSAEISELNKVCRKLAEAQKTLEQIEEEWIALVDKSESV